MRLWVGLVAGCWLALCAPAANAETPRVTVIGDSVMMAVQSPGPMAILRSGLDVRMEVGVCRRLTEQSCPYEGGRVPTLVARVQQMGAGGELAPNVVVEMGYNDPAATFAAAVEQSLAVLHDAGARHVFWLTLREAQGQYPGMNEMLRAAALHHPELTVVDWNLYASTHPEYFQTDGEHLVYAGGLGLAHLMHDTVLGLPVSYPPAARSVAATLTAEAPPAARVGPTYAARLRATGGVGPYRWRIASGRLPAGLHLLANGRLYGTARRAGVAIFALEVRDAHGVDARVRTALVVQRATPSRER